ncbi:B-box zinc finger protein [Candidatus Hydrogenedentota bacterium]
MALVDSKSVCKNHPDKAAVGRCKRCGIAVCKECALMSPRGVFCSEVCQEQFVTFEHKAKELDKQDRPFRAKRKIAGLIKTGIIVAVVAAALYYLLVMKQVRSVADFVALIKSFAGK